MLGSGSAGNSALVATDHCRLLVDGGLSARQLVLRLAQCGITPNQLDGVLLTHEHGDHVCGLEVLCRKFHIPIYCNSLTAEAIRGGTLSGHRNWRLFQTGSDFSVCDITVQTFPVPHDAVDPPPCRRLDPLATTARRHLVTHPLIAPLTLRDLDVIKAEFARVYSSMNHARIDYPTASGGVTSEFAAV